MRVHLSKLGLLSILLLSGCGGSSDDVSQADSIDLNIPQDYEINLDVNNRGGVYYEIFVRAFADSTQSLDGIGDFRGVEEKIPYLQDLGVEGVWLMPIMESSSYHGYNVDNYYAVERDYGTMEHFESMMAAFDAANIDVILDLVINHTGNMVEYFKKSAAYVTGRDRSPENERYADWYTWKDYNPGPGTSTQGTYRQFENTGYYYLANFDGAMPDLNLDNPEVREEILNIAKFWLDKGVHGFRLDATLWFYENNTRKNIEFLRWFCEEVKKMHPEAYIVGETWTGDALVAEYYESGIDSQFWFGGAEVNGYFHSAALNNNGKLIAQQIVNYDKQIKRVNPNALNSAFLSNHDNNRSGGYAEFARYEGKQKLAASMYLLTPGVPFIYYGEEIGLKGSGRDENKRLPMIWQEAHTTHETTPVRGSDYQMRYQVNKGAHDLLEEPFSLTNHYRKVISIRNEYPGFRRADVEVFDTGIVPFAGLRFIEPSFPNGEIIVIHNVGLETRTIDIDPSYVIIEEINTEQLRPILENGSLTLERNSTVILTKGS